MARTSPANQPAFGDDGPVVIRMYDQPTTAEIDAAILRSSGIPVQTTGTELADSLNYYGLAVRRIELLVPESRAQEAIQVLREARVNDVEATEWQCSACDEINARTFDECWNCGKLRGTDDREVTAPLQEDGTSISLPDVIETERSENPYAAPIVQIANQPVVENAETKKLTERATRSLLLSPAFPPLLLYALYVSASSLISIASGQLEASPPQRRRLSLIVFTSGILFILMTLLSLAIF